MNIIRFSDAKICVKNKSKAVMIMGTPIFVKDDPLLLEAARQVGATPEELEEALKDVKRRCYICPKEDPEYTFTRNNLDGVYVCSKECIKAILPVDPLSNRLA